MVRSAERTTHDGEDELPLEQVVSGAVTALTLLVAFGLLFAGVPFFWVAFPVGFGGVLPMALGLVKYHRRQQPRGATYGPDSDTENALDELRQRYARGDLTEAEFERKVEHLLATETVADAETYADRVRTQQSPDDRATEYESE